MGLAKPLYFKQQIIIYNGSRLLGHIVRTDLDRIFSKRLGLDPKCFDTKINLTFFRVIVLIIVLDNILASRCFIKWLHSKARALMNPLARRWGCGQRSGRDHPGQGERAGLQKA